MANPITALNDINELAVAWIPTALAANVVSAAPWLFSNDTVAAAIAIKHPDLAYPPMPQPAVPAAVPYGTSRVPMPVSVEDAQVDIDSLLADAMRRTQEANLNYFSSVDDWIRGATEAEKAMDWKPIAILAAVGIAALVLFTRSK
jgi:hypothetical protein